MLGRQANRRHIHHAIRGEKFPREARAGESPRLGQLFKHGTPCRLAQITFPDRKGREGAERLGPPLGLNIPERQTGTPLVGLPPERKRQFSQPPLHPMRFNVRKVLAVYARCALVGAALGIGMRQNIP